MRVIGLIGGMSWESTATYYQLINEGVKMHLGGLHSAQIRLHSVDFAEIAALQSAGDWSPLGENAPIKTNDWPHRQLELSPPDNVGDITEGTDHCDAGTLVDLCQAVGNYWHLYAKNWSLCMINARKKANSISNNEQRAQLYCNEVLPFFDEIR